MCLAYDRELEKLSDYVNVFFFRFRNCSIASLLLIDQYELKVWRGLIVESNVHAREEAEMKIDMNINYGIV